MKKYAIILLAMIICIACHHDPLKTSSYHFKIKDTAASVSEMQIDSTKSVLKKRLLNSKYENPVVSYDGAKKIFTVTVNGDIDKDFIGNWLLKPCKTFFYETYRIDELAPVLTIQPSASSDEKEKKEKFVASISLTGPQISSTGVAYYPPYIGAVKESGIAAFEKAKKNMLFDFPVDNVFAYGLPEQATHSKIREIMVYALKINDGSLPIHQYTASAKMAFDEMGRASIRVNLNAAGAKRFERMTTKNVNKALAIVMDGTVYSAPTVVSAIAGGNMEIAGNFSAEEARQLANMLSAGYLPLALDIVR